MRKRIYIGGLNQETNTFCPEATGLENYKRGYYLRGWEIFGRMRETNTELAGFWDILGEREAIELAPGVAGWSVTSGKLTAEAFASVCSDIVGSLKESLPVDGVLLSMHGSLISEDNDDCEGLILEQVRNAVGPDVPVVCTLDYHAVLSKKMVQNSDLLVGYRTYPHVDFRATGQRGARKLIRLIEDSAKPQATIARLRIILSVENAETQQGPIAGVIERLEDLDERPEVISCSFFCTHPWVDIESPGLAFLVYTNKDSGQDYGQIGREVMEYLWGRREEFYTDVPKIEEFLNEIHQHAKPVILVDLGDITSAGGIGDSTEILRALLSKGGNLKAAVTIVDPATVNAAFRVGVGKAGKFNVGGQADYGYNRKVPLPARVMRLDSQSVKGGGASLAGLELDMGRRARLEIDGRIELIVCEKTSLVHDPQVLRSMGVNPEDYDIIVQKSHKLFRAAYEDIAKSVVAVDTPGFTDRNLKRLTFRKVKRPIYPLDDVQVPEIVVE